MLRILVRVYTAYAGFFEEVGILDEFQRLLARVEELQEPKDHLTFLLKVGELYNRIRGLLPQA